MVSPRAGADFIRLGTAMAPELGNAVHDLVFDLHQFPSVNLQSRQYSRRNTLILMFSR